jgi:bifunctional lysine-specific demethylase and histidyl-hydroxylase NO66
MGARQGWLDDPLGALIGPERIADFFARIYEREALVIAHDAPTHFSDLLSLDDIDRIVTSTDLREGQLDMADASRTLARSDYLDASGLVDRGAVAERHRDGATIILQQAHQHQPMLARFCRGLEHVFSAHVQTNIYLTPPNAQGFRTHFDNHDVFVIQISGEKQWRLYDMPVDTPYRGEQYRSGEHATGELRQEFLLRAGDCAYVPRGLMHDALTSGSEPSLHVTVGLITRTWADLMLEAVSEVALREKAFRRSLPPGFARAGFDRTAALAQLKELIEIASREVALDPALDLTIDTFIRSRAADNRAAISEASRPVLPGDRFRLRAHAPFRIAEDGEKTIVLIAPGGDLNFPIEARAGVERAMSGDAFSLGDIVAEKSEALVLLLLAHGLIERV